MRLSCPNCQTEYDVPEAALSTGGRTLRCARCGHQWRHGPDAAPELAAAPAAAAATMPERNTEPAVPEPDAEPPAPALADTPDTPAAAPVPTDAAAPAPQPTPGWLPSTPRYAPPPAPIDSAAPAPVSSWLPQDPAAGQPMTPDGGWLPPSPPDVPEPPPPVEERVFGKPVDETARAEVVSAARDEEKAVRPDPDEPNTTMGRPLHGAAAPASRPAASQDGFAALVQAARNRAIEYEPENPPAPPKVRTSSTLLVVVLAVLLIGALVVLERGAIMQHVPASRALFHKLGLA